MIFPPSGFALILSHSVGGHSDTVTITWGFAELHEQPVFPIGSPAPNCPPSAEPTCAEVRSLQGSVAARALLASRTSAHGSRSHVLHRLEFMHHLPRNRWIPRIRSPSVARGGSG